MKRPEAELDLECFHNWFLVGITDVATGAKWDFQMVDGYPLDVRSITTLLQHYTIVTFNGAGYDIPMLLYSLSGASCAQLKEANDDIIVKKLKPWVFMKKYGLHMPQWLDTYDIMEVAPGVRVGLKQYACRMHSEIVQDTPVDFNKPLPLEHAPEEIYYCRNDRKITAELKEECRARIRQREVLSTRYGVDLRSKSDAQMAEAMVKAEWGRRMAESIAGYMAGIAGAPSDPQRFPHLAVPNYDVAWNGVPRPIIPHYNHGTTFKVRIPDYVHFVTPYMQEFLQVVRECDFLISDKDEAEILGLDLENIKTGVVIPRELKGRDIVIGKGVYRVGIGGLHSSESAASHCSIPGEVVLETADVGSYYPSLILNAGMYPPQLGPLFPLIYRDTYDTRLEAKFKLKKMVVTDPGYEDVAVDEAGLKIVLNGTFGKLFSRYSIFYAPELGIAVTIGGQLSLLMLIERLELSGIRVISANTDGIEMAIPAGREWVAKSIMDWWQNLTKLSLDTKRYLALYSRDVNNYVSLQFDGSTKRKGVFGESGVLKNKHPDLDICADAVVAFLTKGVPLRDTIIGCSDIRKFIRVRGASGGAVWVRDDHDDAVFGSKDDKHLLGGVYLGRAVRWYYAKEGKDFLVDSRTLNKVGGSDGCKPVMTLPKDLPADIDYRYYTTVAEELLEAIGYGNENV